jgi:uncharacterized protein YggU (UPF0235/DUF167 family)
VRVVAPPIEGKANRALIAFLAASLRVSPAALTLVKGAGTRHKVVTVAGLSQAEIRTLLGAPHEGVP